MGKKNKGSKKGGWQDPEQEDFGDNPFAAALGDMSAPEAPEEVIEELERPDQAPPDKEKPPARAHLRMERKGRGGKTVTVVERLGLEPEALERWCSDLKGKLGTGGTVEGEELVFQGDQRGRLAELLAERGVGRVTGGG